jgi:tRNA-2-methylthio-N6-dimethylallyladenosine synthase
MDDDVTEEIKTKRLQEIIELQQSISFEKNQELIDTEEIVLVEGYSRKSDDFYAGRTDSNKVVIISSDKEIQPGTYVKVKINKATHATLFGNLLNNN